MTIQSFVWRPRAKFVAVVDLVISALGLLVTLIYAVLICIATAVVEIVSDGIDKYNKKQAEAGAVKPSPTPKESSTFSLVIIWIGVMVTAFITGLQLWAGWRLLKSTDLRKSPEVAKKHVLIYLILNVIVMLIYVPLNMALYHTYIMTTTGVIIKAILMIVAYQFWDELKSAIAAAVAPVSKVAPI